VKESKIIVLRGYVSPNGGWVTDFEHGTLILVGHEGCANNEWEVVWTGDPDKLEQIIENVSHQIAKMEKPGAEETMYTEKDVNTTVTDHGDFYCNSCNTPLAGDERYCSNCGIKLVWHEEQED
jgi:hypothetical protein